MLEMKLPKICIERKKSYVIIRYGGKSSSYYFEHQYYSPPFFIGGNMTKEEAILSLFKSYLVTKKHDEFKPNEKALTKGILINDKANKKIVNKAIEMYGVDSYLLNQTFHKSFKTVVKSSEEKLFVEAITHYFTTYTFENLGIFSHDYVFVPHEKLDVKELDKNIKLTNIKEITKKELHIKLWELAKSNIALSKRTIELIVILSEYMKVNEKNIDDITNKELKMHFYKKLAIVPEDPIEFIRFIVFLTTNQTLLIKNNETINAISRADKTNVYPYLLIYIGKYGIIPLASIFNRFKPIFIALKSPIEENYLLRKNIKIKLKDPMLSNLDVTKEELEVNRIINKISHLSKKYHKPMKKNNLDNIVEYAIIHENEKAFIESLTKDLKKISIFRVIRIRNYLNLYELEGSNKVYKIRNNKVWVTNKETKVKCNVKKLKKILDDIIVDKLKENVNSKVVLMDKGINIVLPQSEKQFVGSIPFGSSLSLEKSNLVFGIHWNNLENQRVDLDLKLISNKFNIGWNTDYKREDKLIFSGDMTDASLPNGASEYIYVDKTVDEGLLSLKVNNFNRTDDVLFDIIVAKANKKDIKKNYIVDPNKIITKVPNVVIEKNQYEHSIGSIMVGTKKLRLIFTDLVTSNNSISSEDYIEKILREYIAVDSEIRCRLKDYLKKAGAKIVYTNKEKVDIDLSINNLDKTTLINLLN